MDTLRSAGHLQRELGDELFAAIVSSDNTEAVRDFAQKLVASGLPTTMTLGGVAYDILSFLRGEEKSVKGDVVVSRAKEMRVHNGKGEREHLLAYQAEIPVMLRGHVVFVFTDDRHPDGPGGVYYVCWGGARWVALWFSLGHDWYSSCRVLRRK